MIIFVFFKLPEAYFLACDPLFHNVVYGFNSNLCPGSGSYSPIRILYVRILRIYVIMVYVFTEGDD